MTEESRKQFESLKALHPDALLMFRDGDSYAMYADDAETAEKHLPVFAVRSDGNEAIIPEVRFPHFHLDIFLPRLIRAGFRIAICDPI